MSIVVDASAAVEMLRGTTTGRRVEVAVATGDACAPAHLDAEVLSALGRLARADAAEEPHVLARLTSLRNAPITRYPCGPLLPDAWAVRANAAVRDALYVGLARRLVATPLTVDERLAKALTGTDVVVVVP